jgi:hypothetical protein
LCEKIGSVRFSNCHKDNAIPHKTTPFPDLPEAACALWGSLCQTDDDTLIAVSDINGLPEKNGIWIVTAKIRRAGPGHGREP